MLMAFVIVDMDDARKGLASFQFHSRWLVANVPGQTSQAANVCPALG